MIITGRAMMTRTKMPTLGQHFANASAAPPVKLHPPSRL